MVATPITADQKAALDGAHEYIPAIAADRTHGADFPIGTMIEELQTGLDAADTQGDALVAAQLGTISLTPGAEAGDEIDVVGALLNYEGVALGEGVPVWIESLAQTVDKGDLAAATAAVGTVVEAFNPATGPNVMAMTTAEGGLFSFKVADDAVEDVVVRVMAEGCHSRVIVLTFAA